MDRAIGSTIFDADGRSYTDLCAGFGVLALGHNSEVLGRVLARHVPAKPDSRSIVDAPPIAHAMGDVYASTAKVRLLEALVAAMPPHLTRAALALTGSQAVEIAVKTAVIATGRGGFITFAGGYHGLDLGILPLTARGDFRAPFAPFVLAGHVETLPYGATEAQLEAAVTALAARGQALAGVLVEPIQGRAGVRVAPAGWLDRLKGFTTRQNALLIFDEVFTGLGRSGRMTFATETPADLLCLGKALGGGLPLSACLGTEAAMTAWPESTGEALHTGTFFGHPLTCEAAVATLAEIRDRGLVRRAHDIGAQALIFLREALGSRPQVRDIRGQGLMMAIEMVEPGSGARAMDRLRACGVVALASGESGECLAITPALTIPWADLKSSLEAIVAVLTEGEACGSN